MSQHIKEMPLGETGFSGYVGPQTPEEWVIEDALILLPAMLAELSMPVSTRIQLEGVIGRLRSVQQRAEALRNA